MLGESGEGASRKCDCAHEPFTPAKLWLCGRLSCGTGRCYDARKLRVWAPALLPGPGISHFVHSVARASLPHLSESRRQLPARGTLRRWINVAQSADMPRPAAALSRSLRTRPSRSGGAGPAPVCRHPARQPPAAAFYNIWRGRPRNPRQPQNASHAVASPPPSPGGCAEAGPAGSTISLSAVAWTGNSRSYASIA